MAIRERAGIWLAAGIGVTALLAHAGGVAARIELPVRDLALRLLPSQPASHVAVVAIDEDSLRQLGPWPWRHERLVALVEAIVAVHPRALVVDILLTELQTGDERLGAALGLLPTVVAATLAGSGPTWLLPSPPLAQHATIACASFDPDHDGVMRRLASTKQAEGRSVTALAVAAAALAGSERPIALGEVLRPDFRTAIGSLPVVSATAITGSGRERLAGRVVFLGVTAAGLGDRIVIPTEPSPLPGVIAQALATESVIARASLHAASPLAAALLAALLAGVVAVAASARRSSTSLVAGAVALAPLAALPPALALAHYELPVVTLMAAGLLALLASEARVLRRTERVASDAAASLAAQLGGQPLPAKGSSDRLAALTTLAAEIAQHRRDEVEARRVLAHELKTPLTSVRGLTQLLAEFNLSPQEARRVAAMAAAEAVRLTEMVEGLLELERLPLQSFEAVARELDVSALALERCELLARATGRSVVCKSDGTAIVRAEPALFRRVLDNLIGNALKFSPPETDVQVRVARRGQGTAVEVTDHGPGIPAAERDAVFRRFARGSTAKGTTGLGLGLAVVAEVVTWHGGRVELDTQPGAGSTFRVVLPQAKTER